MGLNVHLEIAPMPELFVAVLALVRTLAAVKSIQNAFNIIIF